MRAYSGDYEASVRMPEDLNRRWPSNFTILDDLIDFASGLGFWDALRAPAARAATSKADAERTAASLTTPRRWNRATRPSGELLHRYGAWSQTGIALNWIVGVSVVGLSKEAIDLAGSGVLRPLFDPDGPLPGGIYPGTMLGPGAASTDAPVHRPGDRLGLCAYWEAIGPLARMRRVDPLRLQGPGAGAAPRIITSCDRHAAWRPRGSSGPSCRTGRVSASPEADRGPSRFHARLAGLGGPRRADRLVRRRRAALGARGRRQRVRLAEDGRQFGAAPFRQLKPRKDCRSWSKPADHMKSTLTIFSS